MNFRRSKITKALIVVGTLLLGGCVYTGELLSQLSQKGDPVNPVATSSVEVSSPVQPQPIATASDPCSGKFLYNHVINDFPYLKFEGDEIAQGISFGENNVDSCRIVSVAVRPLPDSELIVQTNAGAIAITQGGKVLAESNGDQKVSFVGTTGEWLNIEAVVRVPLETVRIEIDSKELPQYSVYRE